MGFHTRDRDAEAAVVCVRSVTRWAPWSIWSRIWRVDGKPIECREMLKNNTVSRDASSHMAILHRRDALPRRAQPGKMLNPGSSTQNFQEPINAHPLEKVKRAVSAGGECGNVYFLHHCACLQRRLKQGLIPMHQVLQKSKRENT